MRTAISTAALTIVLALTHTAAGQTFSNSALVIIPGAGTSGPASLFPTSIAVSGLVEPIESVTVNIPDIDHALLRDIDVLLVGPEGHTVVLMSDAGPGNQVVDLNLNFMNGAPSLTQGLVTSGTYSPTDFDTLADEADIFGAPAPSEPYGGSLSVFRGTNGNGTWKLFVTDDRNLGTGRFQTGWSLTITQQPLPPPTVYQGRLTQSGIPVTGTADFRFTVYDDPTAGAIVGATVEVDNVNVANGLFAAELPFSSGMFSGAGCWLAIEARSPAGSGSFTPLDPRQRIGSAPEAIHARVATNAIEASEALHAATADLAVSAQTLGNAVMVSPDGNVGIGTNQPASKLHMLDGRLRIDGVWPTSPSIDLVQDNSTPGGTITGAFQVRVNTLNAFQVADYGTDLGSNPAVRFEITNTGKVGLGISTFGMTDYVNTWTGARLSTGGAWINNCDRNAKEVCEPVDGRAVLARVATMPITTWNYKVEGQSIRHMGPMAQDFHAAFQLGSSETSIGTVDADGVALAAIQGLNELVREKDVRLARQDVKIQTLESRLAAIEKKLAQIAEGDTPTNGTDRK